MALTQAIAVGGVQLFKLRLLSRMQVLAREVREGACVLPVAVLLLADDAHGGWITGPELARRFGLADFEVANLLDFYFPGWSPAGGRVSGKGVVFDPRGLEGFRQSLRDAGVGIGGGAGREAGDRGGGGKAELILVDASQVRGAVSLNFTTAIRCDLGAALAALPVPPGQALPALVQSLADTATAVRRQGGDGLGPPSFSLSERLGLAFAGRSLLAPFLDRWQAALRAPLPSAGPAAPAVLSAAGLAAVMTRGLGPDLALIDL